MQSRPDIALAPTDAPSHVAHPAPPHGPADAPAALDDALRLVGPEHAAELLDRLAADLARMSEALADGCVRRDIAALRDAGHVLTALLGTVGEAADAEAAGALRAAVAAGIWPKIDAAAAGTGCRVARLRETVAARRAALETRREGRAP